MSESIHSILHDSGDVAEAIHGNTINGDVIINGAGDVVGWRERLRGAWRLMSGKQVVANRAVIITGCTIQGKLERTS